MLSSNFSFPYLSHTPDFQSTKWCPRVYPCFFTIKSKNRKHLMKPNYIPLCYFTAWIDLNGTRIKKVKFIFVRSTSTMLNTQVFVPSLFLVVCTFCITTVSPSGIELQGKLLSKSVPALTIFPQIGLPVKRDPGAVAPIALVHPMRTSMLANWSKLSKEKLNSQKRMFFTCQHLRWGRKWLLASVFSDLKCLFEELEPQYRRCGRTWSPLNSFCHR